MSGEPQQPPGHPLEDLPPAEREAAIRGALEQARAHHRGGDLQQAEMAYRLVLKADPENADALHLLGVMAAQTGHSRDAIELIGRAIEREPRVASYHANLGNALRLSGQREAAVKAYRRAIRLAPDMPAAHVNLANTLKRLGRLREAIAAARRATELLPNEADAFVSLGNICRRAGDLAGASAAYRRALDLDPKVHKGCELLSRVLHRQGDLEGAATILRQWLEQDPGHPVATHMLAAMTDGDAGPRASDAYVRTTFDDFADTFDERLKELDYRAPRLAIEAVQRALGGPQGTLDVLDAGCGTGWCGPLLRPYARRLAGVDLSPGMLTLAKRRDTYDSLTAAELTAYLAASQAEFDLIVSTDVLIYFADLAPVLAAAAGALRPGGRLVFTLEHLDEPRPEGFRLNPHGRYSHTADHAQDRLAAAGLAAVVEHGVLRSEAGEPVPGLVVTATREAARCATLSSALAAACRRSPSR